MLSHNLHPALRPWVRKIWRSDPDNAVPRTARELALPTGTMDLVVRLSDAPIRLFEDVHASRSRSLGHAVVSGVRSSCYVRDTREPASSIGVHFQPGGAAALLGIPADELCQRHTRLEVLWGRGAETLRQELLEAKSPRAQFALLERCLLARLHALRDPHWAVAHLLDRFQAAHHQAPVGSACRETGLSQRRVIELFRRSVGLSPKVYCRVRRFNDVVQSAARTERVSWAHLAVRFGYSDQAHLNREFRAISGLTPGAYEPLSPDHPNHVPLPRDSRPD